MADSQHFCVIKPNILLSHTSPSSSHRQRSPWVKLFWLLLFFLWQLRPPWLPGHGLHGALSSPVSSGSPFLGSPNITFLPLWSNTLGVGAVPIHILEVPANGNGKHLSNSGA